VNAARCAATTPASSSVTLLLATVAADHLTAARGYRAGPADGIFFGGSVGSFARNPGIAQSKRSRTLRRLQASCTSTLFALRRYLRFGRHDQGQTMIVWCSRRRRGRRCDRVLRRRSRFVGARRSVSWPCSDRGRWHSSRRGELRVLAADRECEEDDRIARPHLVCHGAAPDRSTPLLRAGAHPRSRANDRGTRFRTRCGATSWRTPRAPVARQ
jgi:hypothetical protein